MTALDEVKVRVDLLGKESLQRLLMAFLGSCLGQDSEEGHLHPEILFWDSAVPEHGFRYTHLRPYGNIPCLSCNHFGHMSLQSMPFSGH